MSLAYLQDQRYFAQIGTGMEEYGVRELERLGASEVEVGFRGLHFVGSPEVLYRINYESRLCTRILAPLVRFRCRSQNDLYDATRSVDWGQFLDERDTFAVFSNVRRSVIENSAFGSLKVKDAIVDQFRDRSGQRPSIDKDAPQVGLNLHLDEDRGTLSLDTSGGSLHRRGYRRRSMRAPMQETLAASILEIAAVSTAAEASGGQSEGSSGTVDDCPLLDPMCGSGTILAEALMRRCRIPAGSFRRYWGFFRLPDYDQSLWNRVRDEADGRIRAMAPEAIVGSDIDKRCVHASRYNLAVLPFGNQVPITRSAFEELDTPQPGIIITNPPYGHRLASGEDLHHFYQAYGDFLKQKCQGSIAYVYFGDREWIKSIGLKPSWKKPLTNGGLDGRLLEFKLY